MPRTIVVRQAGWNADGSWQEMDVYWEDGWIHDDQWLDENCFIRRTDMCL